jgi:hypothetical protein
MFDFVRNGDVQVVKRQEEKIGLDIQFLFDAQLKQNALFTAVLVPSSQHATEMIDYLV